MKLIKEIILLPPAYSADAESEENRNKLALRAQSITQITTAAENDIARCCAVDIRKHSKLVEAIRVELTAPLLNAQRQLKSLADDHLGPLTAELSRLERLATNFQEQERRRVQLEEQRRQEEIVRLERERLELEAKAAELAAKANTEKQLDKAIAAETVAIAKNEQVMAAVMAPPPVVARASGQQFKKVVRYEVTDLKKLYAARPELCNLEIKPSAVNATCMPFGNATFDQPDTEQVPGLKLWWENKTTFSSR